MIYGYKGFTSEKTTLFGDYLEEGVTYTVEGPLQVGMYGDGNGYHMCGHLSDVFRFLPKGTDVTVAYVEGSDENIEFEDNYWGYYHMYVCRSIKVIDYLTREEIIDGILDSTPDDIEHFLMTFDLNEEETDKFLDYCRKNHMLMSYIFYYQMDQKDINHKSFYEKQELFDAELKRIDEQKVKRIEM